MDQVPDRVGLARADVRQVGAEAQAAEQDRLVVEIILRDGAALSPAALEVRAESLRANLLAVAFHAAERAINLRALPGLPGTIGRIERVIGLEFDRFLPANLQLRQEQQAPERTGQRGKDAQEKQRPAVHGLPPAPSASAPVKKPMAAWRHGSP